MQWENHHDIKKDDRFVLGVAYELTHNNSLREEIIDYPEKLIELCFTVVDKDKKVVPFFFNEVQNGSDQIGQNYTIDNRHQNFQKV